MNTAVTVFFLILRVFSLYFLAVSLFGLCRRRTPEPAARLRRFAVLIAARNEESCIAGLIESLRAQHYPLELVDIWVLPNNCTDRTAEAARRAGAQVLEMPASVRSKGAALHTAAKALLRSARNYDAFCVFDADNEADPAFLSEMNRALDRAAIVKSRILAKNRTQAGISACYEIYFCSANHFLNRAREAMGLSARVIGTGFAIRRDLLETLDGFPCRTLTEDAELYAACLCRGARIGYCETAVTYDEEPVTWRASLVQRRRWMSGILQVARLTLPELLANFLRQPSLTCLDGLLQLSFPFLQALTPFFALEALLAGSMSLQGLPVSLLTAYAGCLAAAVAALALERRLDRKLVGGMLLYPVFMACFLPLQTLNKVFMYNCVGDKTYDNCWDFVAEGEHGLFMDIDSEIVGKNFLYMLTRDDYAAWMKESFEALSADEQAYFQPTITEMEADAADLGLGADGAYALAWIKLWVESYNAQTDDGPICNTLVDASAKDQFGLLVYSKLRSVEESSSVSVNNIKVAAYEDGYQGIGGYGYCHYLFVTDNSPLPWTACAFIAYMTCTADGFSAWGKDMGGYSSNPTVAEETEANFHHSIGGMAEDGTTVEFAAKNDRGYEWWTTNGKLVLEDPEYCADVAFTVGSWIEMLTKYSAG